MFFKRKQYPLPKFPAEISTLFRSLCLPLAASERESFIQQVEQAIEEVQARVSDRPGAERKLVEGLVKATKELMDRYDELKESQKSLSLGAIRYFLIATDPVPDGVFASGFDDDVKVMNHVLEELGLLDLCIDPE